VAWDNCLYSSQSGYLKKVFESMVISKISRLRTVSIAKTIINWIGMGGTADGEEPGQDPIFSYAIMVLEMLPLGLD